MASVVDICNLALSHIGDRANVASISPPEGSPPAAHCARLYPIARDTALEAHAWSFAVRRAQLAALTLPTTAAPWSFAFALPADCLRPVALLDARTPGLADDGSGEIDYAVESLADGSPVVLTDSSVPVLKYIARVDNPTRYSPGFTIALSYLLASYLCGPLTKSVELKGTMEKLYTARAAAAAADDSRSQRAEKWREERVPGWIKAR